jgi:4-amino-4-deoxy-L-arabinose transferase-like glycosyltransferase
LTRATDRQRKLWLLTLVLVLRLPSFVRLLMDIDEAEYASIACRMLDGGLPYRDGVTIKLPGILWVYQGVFTLFGRYNMRAIHLVCALCAFATALVCRQITRRLAGESAGWWAASLYAIFSVGYYSKMQAANTEMFAVLPAALAVLGFVEARRQARPLYYVLSGLACGVAIVFKQPLVLLPIALAATALVRVLRRDRPPLPELRATAGLAAGTLATLALLALYLSSQGILGDGIFWTWTYIWRHYFPSVQDSFLIRFLSEPVPFALSMAPLVLLAAYARGRALAPVLAWLVGMITAGFVGGRMFGHYFLLTVPPLCVLAGVGATRLASMVSEPRRRLFRATLVAIALLTTGQLAGAAVFEGATDSFWSAKPDYLQATKYLDSVTRPDERVFVWGWFPALYVAGDRCPSTRFVYAHHLAGKAPTSAGKRAHSVPEGWREVMEDLEREPPPYLLDTSHGGYGFDYAPIERYPLLWDYVNRSYSFDREIAGVRFYRRR